MAVLWECRLNLAICHANDFMIKLIKTHDASSSPRLIRIGSFFLAAKARGKGWEVDGWIRLRATHAAMIIGSITNRCSRKQPSLLPPELYLLEEESSRPDSSEQWKSSLLR